MTASSRPVADDGGAGKLRSLPTAGPTMSRFAGLVLLVILAVGGCANGPEISGRAPLTTQAENTRERCTFADDDAYAENASRCFYAYFLVSDTLERMADETRAGRRWQRRQIENVVRSANLILPYEYLQSPEASDTVRSSLAVIIGSDPLAASLDIGYRTPRTGN